MRFIATHGKEQKQQCKELYFSSRHNLDSLACPFLSSLYFSTKTPLILLMLLYYSEKGEVGNEFQI